MTEHKPRQVDQLDGSAMQGENCGPATGAVLVDGATHGGTTLTGARFRTLTGDRSGGIEVRQLAWVAEHYFGIDVDVRDNMPWADAIDHLRRGYPMAVIGGYDPIHSTSISGSHTFRGNHFWLIWEYRVGPDGHGQVRKYDPLCDGRGSYADDDPEGRWISITLLHLFTGALMTSAGRAGPNRVFAGFGPRRGGLSAGGLVPLPSPSAPTAARLNPMIIAGTIELPSDHEMHLVDHQPIRRSPGGPVITHAQHAGWYRYYGIASGVKGWRIVGTWTANFTDHVRRYVLAFVPLNAGTVRGKPGGPS